MASLYQAVFFFTFIAFSKVTAAPCTQDDVMKCVAGLDNLNVDDIAAMCKPMMSMISCFENLGTTCELSSEMKVQVEQQMQSPQIQELKPLCEGASSGGGGGCTAVEIAECMKPMETLNADEGNQDEMCNVYTKMESCVTNLLPHCTDAVKANMENSLESLKSTAELCAVPSGCRITDLHKCVEGFQEPDDLSALCGPGDNTIRKAMVCFDDFKSKCKNKMSDEVQKYVTQMDSMMDVECCEALFKGKQECSKLLPEESAPFVASDDKCMKAESAWNCIAKHDLESKCLKKGKENEMTKGVKSLQDGLDENVKACESMGYNITLVKPGKHGGDSGVQLHPTIAVLLSAFLLGLFSFYY